MNQLFVFNRYKSRERIINRLPQTFSDSMPRDTTFLPFDSSTLPDDQKIVLYYGMVRNIVDSYHDRFDIFIELIQNSFDALEERWKDVTHFDETADDGHPWLKINIDARDGENFVEITDNGCGVDDDHFVDVFKPNISLKILLNRGRGPKRGHKGVAMTYILHGHNYVEFHSKRDQEKNMAKYVDGARWLSTPIEDVEQSIIPELDPRIPFTDNLNTTSRGSYVKVKFDELSRLKKLKLIGGQNKLKYWKHLLTTRTAAGFIAFGQEYPPWVKKCKITLTYRSDIQSPISDNFNPEFFKPHTYAATGMQIKYSALTPSIRRRYEVIWDELNYANVRYILSNDLNATRQKSEEEYNKINELFEKLKPDIYFCLTNENTYFKDKFDTQISGSNKDIIITGGFLIGTEKMPVGSISALIPSTLPPEIKSRLFVAYHCKDIRPDIGRKTFPIELVQLIGFINQCLNRLLHQKRENLIRDPADANRRTTNLSSAQQDLRDEQIRVMDSRRDIVNSKIFKTEPKFESEVLLLFFELLARDKLLGFDIKAVPGSSSRYDIFFNYELIRNAQSVYSDSNSLGLADSSFVNNQRKIDSQWCEVKLFLDNAIEDFRADDGVVSKKYFEQVNLIVAWDFHEELMEYTLTEITEGNIDKRLFFGCNYYLSRGSSDHIIGVILLKKLWSQIYQ